MNNFSENWREMHPEKPNNQDMEQNLQDAKNW